MKCFVARLVGRLVFGAGIAVSPLAAAYAEPFIPRLILSSTIPANGDLNPYGLVFVPGGFAPGGTIAPGDVLVSNFNDFNNLQGRGTTIIKLTPNSAVAPAVPAGQSGNALTYFAGQQHGLTLALGVLRGALSSSATSRRRMARRIPSPTERCKLSIGTASSSPR